MTLYEKIDFLCETNGITRKELARRTGVSYATLNSMFARQSTNISLETIRAISNFFHVSLDYLLADEVAPVKPDDDRLSAFDELKPEFQDYVLQQIDKLLELQNTGNDD